MANESKNAALESDVFDEESFDYDSLEKELEAELKDLQGLEEDELKIANPDALGDAVTAVIWDQFINQVGEVAGEDFIKENRGMTLDLRGEAHIQTVDNFEQQKYAKHNTYVDYEKRGEEYRSDFYTDPNIKPNAKQKQEQRYNEKTNVWETYDNVDGEWKKTLKPDYRKAYEEDRMKDKGKVGSASRHKDHQVADATIARDPEAGVYMTKNEKVKVANADANLNDLDPSANISKSDHDGEKWAKHKRTGSKGNGQTNAEYFGLDEEEYLEKDKKSKEAYEKEKNQKKEENVALGKKSQKEEAFRVGGKALRAAIMGLLAELGRKIIQKLISWIKSGAKNIKTFIQYVKDAITGFVKDVKKNILMAGNAVSSAIITAIFGPVANLINKVVMFIKQSVRSLKEAIQYIKDPKNRKKPFSVLMLEVGKIVVAGLTAAGAIVLGEVIEAGLTPIPGFGVEIPLIGSLANIIGIFLGAVVAGIAGALVIHVIDKMVSDKLKAENRKQQIDKANKILEVQGKQLVVAENRLKGIESEVEESIKERHKAVAKEMRSSVEKIMSANDTTDNEEILNNINDMLDNL